MRDGLADPEGEDMSSAGWLWLVGGVVAGQVHARALWLSVQHQRSVAWGPLRLLAVVVFLGAAIYLSGLMAVAGWGLGFLCGVLWWARSRRRAP